MSACGFIGGASIASAEELQNALEGQKPVTEEEISKLKALAETKNVPIENILRAHNLRKITDMTMNDYVRAVNNLKGM